MGESKRRKDMQVVRLAESVALQTAGGWVQVNSDSLESTTRFGWIASFMEFLHFSGLYERWQVDVPLHCAGPHSSATQDIRATWFLLPLVGHRRYVHISAIRFDGVIPSG